MASIKEQTLSSVKWTAIEKFGLQGMQFIFGIIMACLLTPDDYGVIGMIAIFLAISSTFIDSGFGKVLVREQNCTEADYNTVFYFNIVVAFVCYVFLFVAAPWIADFFHTPILCAIVCVQSILQSADELPYADSSGKTTATRIAPSLYLKILIE